MLQVTYPLRIIVAFATSHYFMDSPSHKEKKLLKCASRVRFLVRQPGDFLSYRQGGVAQNIAKGCEHGGQIETANQTRITSAA